jgi:hypothetical protein
VCTHGLNITRWPLHAFGRHVVEAYRHLLPPEIQELDGSSSSSGSDDDGGAVLNVVIQKRPGDTRQLLNMEELLSRCNGWQHRTRAGLQLRTKCWEVCGHICLHCPCCDCLLTSGLPSLNILQLHSAGRGG